MSSPDSRYLVLAAIYGTIRHQFQEFPSVNGDEHRDYPEESTALIRALPPVGDASVEEMVLVLHEVSMGNLELLFKHSDGAHKMGDYARMCLEEFFPYEEFPPSRLCEHVEDSPIWPHLSSNSRP